MGDVIDFAQARKRLAERIVTQHVPVESETMHRQPKLSRAVIPRIAERLSDTELVKRLRRIPLNKLVLVEQERIERYCAPRRLRAACFAFRGDRHAQIFYYSKRRELIRQVAAWARAEISKQSEQATP